MKRPDRVTAIFGAVVLAAVVAVGAFSAYAAGGGQDDPLVTLSYLTQVVTPELMDMVDETVAANEKAMMERINALLDGYSQEVDGTEQSASYSVVTLSARQALYLEAGSEVLLRSGNTKISTGGSPALLDTTGGGMLEAGGTLVANRLYISPLEGCTVAVSSDALFLVRGGFTVK